MNQTIPILFMHPWATLYGSETSLYLLIKNLNRQSFHPIVVLPEEGPLREMLQRLDVPVFISPLLPWVNKDDSSGEALRWLADFPERVQRIVDVVHHWDIKIIHSNVADILEGAIAARLTGRLHICTVRNNHLIHTWLKTFISVARVYELLNSLSCRIVPVSNAVKEALSPFVNPTKLRVIYNCVETLPFTAQTKEVSPDPVSLQTENSGEPTIFSIGRVEPQKGFDLLIEAAALVVKAYPSARFSVFGPIHDKLYYQRLLDQVDRLNLKDRLHFEGQTDRVPEQLQASELLVLSSREEGFGLVVLEAMAAGKPVVSTRCGGPEEIIVDGETGYLVRPNDPEALAEAILSVLKDPERARQMGRKGLERVTRHFNARHTAEQYEALYREVLEGGAARPTEDSNGEAVLMGALLEMLDKYGEEFYEMGSRYRHLKRFETRVQKTLAYKAYKTMKSLAGKLI